MIYLIFTSSISNRVGLKNYNERKQRYEYAIGETLKHVPEGIQPIIVENNGERPTFLDDFKHLGKRVPVVYTNNNSISANSKGVNEFMDIKEVIRRMKIEEDDIVIKVTGRYRVLSPLFFKEILHDAHNYDGFIKFFGTCSLRYEKYDCILGYFALRTKFLHLFQPLTIDNYPSAEIAFARYARFCGAKIKDMEHLDIECMFAEDNRILKV